MKHLLRPFFSSALFLLATIVVAGSASAQPNAWSTFRPPPPPPFNAAIHIIKFDTLGPKGATGDPLNGCLSDSTEIWWTTNGGGAVGNWNLATYSGQAPTPFLSGWVNDIAWASSTLGFAIIDSNTDPLDSGVLITHDGGQTWAFDDAAGTPDSGCGIYYNTSNNLLFVSSLDKGLVVSSDNGNTWKTISPYNYYTGFAFIGPQGVVATQGSFPGNGTPTNYWLYTSDGGRNWHQTHMWFESWQPIGIPTTKTFFAATHHFTGDISAIMRSDNGGYSFAPVPGFNNPGDNLTEAMQGDGCSLFASSNSPSGMWFSVTDGAIWQTMPPTAPTPDIDTRFYVSPDTVWSFTGKLLIWTPRTSIITGAIHIWPDSVAFQNARCDTALDTVIHIFGCNCYNNDSLDKVTVTQSTDSIFTVPGSMPRALCTGIAAEGGPDSIHLKYQPTSTLADVGKVDLQFREGGVLIDTFIGVSGNGVAPSIHPAIPSRVVLSAPACGSDDTCFEIINTSCTCVQLMGCDLNGEDPCAAQQIQLIGCDVIDQEHPTLGPGEAFTYCVHFQAGLQKTTGSPPEVDVAFKWVPCGGGTPGETKPVQILGVTTSTTRPLFRGFSIGTDHPRNCCDIPSDTTIYFVDTACDTLILNKPNVFGASDPTMFTIDSNTKPPLHFPYTLPPRIPLPIRIHINCRQGTFTTKIGFTYTIGTSGLNCLTLSGGDTATLTLVSTGPITGPTIPVAVKFGTVSCCDSTQTKTLTITNGCEPDTISVLTLDSANGNFYIVQPGLTLPLALSPNQQVTLTIGFRPRCDGGAGGAHVGHVSLTFSSGTKLSTELDATSSNKATTSPSIATLNFDTLQCDETKCDSITITNASCGPIQVNSIQKPGNAAFTLESPAAGTSIPVGGSAEVVVCLNPVTTLSYGDLTDLAVLAITDPSGNPLTGSWDTINLVAHVNAPAPSYTVTQLATATICSTDTIDESFTFTNTGTCYTYVFQRADPHSSEVTVTPQTARVPVGGTETFHVHFAPGGIVGEVKDSITLVDSAGNSVNVPYDFIDTACNVTNNFVFNITDSTIMTPNCTPGKVKFTASASNGGTITSVALTNPQQFTLTNTSTTTLPDTGTITFDPNQAGNNSATLTLVIHVNDHDTTITVHITGVTVGTKDSARVGVISPSTACLQANDTDIKEFDIVVRDSIPNSLGMVQLRFLVNYDGDMLWNPTYTPGPGFSIVSHTEDKQGLHITLSYAPPTGMTAIPANETILKITQKAAIATSLAGVARVDSVHFNDSAFEACTLRAVMSSTDSASICIDTGICQTNSIYKALTKTLTPMQGIVVVPNPAHKDGSAATLHFSTLVTAPVTADIVNELGNPVTELVNGQLEKGDHSVPIPTNQMAEGAYFVRISMNGYTVVRKFVLEKE